MKKIINSIACLLLCLLLLSFLGCYTEWLPQNGIWYCEELQLQVDFTNNKCYAVINTQEIECYFENDRGSKWISVSIKEPLFSNMSIGTSVLEAEIIRLTDSEMVVQEEKTDIKFVFVKVD